MTDKQWQNFFDLVGQIVDLPMSYQEKRESVLTKAEENSAEQNLDEFLFWFDGSIDS